MDTIEKLKVGSIVEITIEGRTRLAKIHSIEPWGQVNANYEVTPEGVHRSVSFDKFGQTYLCSRRVVVSINPKPSDPCLNLRRWSYA